MTAQSLVRRVVRGTVLAALVVAAAGAAWSGVAAASFLAGAALGLLPIVTWSWAIRPLFESRNWLLLAALFLAKFGVYGLALYGLVFQHRVHVPGFGVGLLFPHFVLAFVAGCCKEPVGGGKAA